LLTGHCIESKAGRDLGGTDRAVAYHQILNGNESNKDDKTDDVIAAHNKLTEGLNHLARGGRSFTPMQQDAARTRYIKG
jgi:hypothetical protein